MQKENKTNENNSNPKLQSLNSLSTQCECKQLLATSTQSESVLSGLTQSLQSAQSASVQSASVQSALAQPPQIEKEYAWKKEQENILKKWADKSLCFKIMHERSYKRYWCLNAWFNIPVIIISTITGTGNFASGSFGSNSQYIIFILGAFNIFAGILATIATYTAVARKVEEHRFASVSWDKFARRLQIELAKSRADRVRAKDFIKSSSEEYDRLIEMSPILPNDIIRWFTDMIKTGESEELGECATCWYECFCFPCGCGFCHCFSIFCCECLNKAKSQDELLDEKENDIELKNTWKQIELPETIGRLKPTEIAIEPEPESPPPLIIIENKHMDGNIINKTDKNEYDIYNLQDSFNV
jgi:hypothetical protein